MVVSFACTDADSGIAGCSPPTTLKNEGAGQKVTGTALDVAGNTASATVDGINIDKTAPTLAGAATTPPTPPAGTRATSRSTGPPTTACRASTQRPIPLTASSPARARTSRRARCRWPTRPATSRRRPRAASTIDRTAPVITGGATTQPNAAGWYSRRGDGGVHVHRQPLRGGELPGRQGPQRQRGRAVRHERAGRGPGRATPRRARPSAASTSTAWRRRRPPTTSARRPTAGAPARPPTSS